MSTSVVNLIDKFPAPEIYAIPDKELIRALLEFSEQRRGPEQTYEFQKADACALAAFFKWLWPHAQVTVWMDQYSVGFYTYKISDDLSKVLCGYTLEEMRKAQYSIPGYTPLYWGDLTDRARAALQVL